MNKLKKGARLPKLKSTSPSQPISPSIELLLKGSGITISLEAIVELSNSIEKDLLPGYRQLLIIDRKIGGVGLHNVNRRDKKDKEYVTGSYRVEFRPLFRPIQYIYAWLSYDDLVWNARRIVVDSCLHIENAIKFRFHISPNRNASLGILLNESRVMLGISSSLLDLLLDLNRVVYRASKHSVEHLKIASHRFTPADALVVYLICRRAGVELLEPTGLFNDWKRLD